MSSVTWTDGFLDSMRSVGDKIADDAIVEVYELGQADRVREILRLFDENPEPVPAGLPPLLARYFAQTGTLPAWADMARIERGNDLMGRYAPMIIVALLCYSLPSCYACAKGVQVLYRSHRLTGDIFRRIAETAQFTVDAFAEGGLGPLGYGIRSAQKIRLMHTTVRYHLRRQPDWDPDWGVPINQEDLAGTLGTFSVTVVRGLAKLGIDLTTQQRDDYFHVWRVIGHILGIDERLNPPNFDDGALLLDRILDRQWAPSKEGREMTRNLLEFMQQMLPGPFFDGLPATLVRHLVGAKGADILAVPPADYTRLGIEVIAWMSAISSLVTGREPWIAKLQSRFGMRALQAGLRLTNRGARYVWRVPTGVSES